MVHMVSNISVETSIAMHGLRSEWIIKCCNKFKYMSVQTGLSFIQSHQHVHIQTLRKNCRPTKSLLTPNDGIY